MWSRIKLPLLIISSFLVLIVVIGLVKFSSIFGFVIIYHYAISNILGFGFSQEVNRIIAVVTTIVIWYLIVRMVLNKDKNRRMIGYVSAGVIFIVHALSLYYIDSQGLVNPVSGKVKYCTVSPLTGEISMFENEAFDRFNQKAVVCSQELVNAYEKSRILNKNSKDIEVPRRIVRHGFINRENGKPLFYFCYDINKEPHFFTASGFCPWGGGKLLPLTSKVGKKLTVSGKSQNDLIIIGELQDEIAGFNKNIETMEASIVSLKTTADELEEQKSSNHKKVKNSKARAEKKLARNMRNDVVVYLFDDELADDNMTLSYSHMQVGLKQSDLVLKMNVYESDGSSFELVSEKIDIGLKYFTSLNGIDSASWLERFYGGSTNGETYLLEFIGYRSKVELTRFYVLVKTNFDEVE